tara:strand:- start:419 stop:1387 length:969 start_codon:yes stop_codon:yes gene_type:complete
MEKKFNVFATRRLHKSALDKIRKTCNLRVHSGKIPIPRNILLKNIKNVDGLICHPYDKIDSDIIKNAKKLRTISTFSVGFDHIDVKFAKNKKILIGYTPEILTNATAELTIGLIIDLLRRMSESDRIIRKKQWNEIFGAYDYTGTEISGKTLGIIGMGRIGKDVASKAIGLGMKISYHNRKRITKNDEKKLNAKFLSFDKLIQESNVISIHVPYSKETHHLINSKIFKKMKKTSFFINTSRGKIVDEVALINALKKKEIQGAGIDVFESEPIAKNSPLLKLENVVLSPHIGSSTQETRKKMSEITAENLLNGLQGKKLLYSV